jgi:NAD(P) transhydrogenase subunit alpha
VQRSITVARNREKTWPPPPVQVSAAPAAVAAPAAKPAPAPKKALTAARKYTVTAIAALVLFLVTAFAPAQLIGNFTVFVLAIVIGYYVIGHVHHALHTPLMSITNAISGIIVVGALLQIDPVGVHQHLRRFRRDPPHARHVLEELTCTRTRSPRLRTSSRPCCSS